MNDETNHQESSLADSVTVEPKESKILNDCGEDITGVERRIKRSLDGMSVHSSTAESSDQNSCLDEQYIISKEARYESPINSTNFSGDIRSHGKRLRPMIMDNPTPTAYDSKVDSLSSVVKPHENPQQIESGSKTVNEDRSYNSEKNDAIAFTFNASSWSVGPRYKLLRLLGRGSYGEVAEASELCRAEYDQKVAIKRIISAFDKEMDAIRLFREIHILRRLRGHPCIIQLLDIIPHKVHDISTFHELYLVFEYIDTDLYKLIMSPQYLTAEHVQTFMYQMLLALKYMHSFSVIHRDLKPANILLNEDCSLKICDFGLARIIDNASLDISSESPMLDESSHDINEISNEDNVMGSLKTISSLKHIGLNRQLTRHVTTRWYRAPELILIQPYSSAVDIWSIGCIFAELLSMQKEVVPVFENRSPLFPGKTCYPLSSDRSPSSSSDKMDQLIAIFEVLGMPSDEDIQSVSSASKYIQSINVSSRRPLESIYQNADKAALDLLNKMLQFNPNKRITAAEALDHEFLRMIRRPDMEVCGDKPFVSPAFLNSDILSIEEIKRKIAEEIDLHKQMSLE